MIEKKPLHLSPHSPKQEQALLCESKILLLGTGIQWGKGLPLYELVLTPKGYIPAGSIKQGDVLIDRMGKPTKVIGVFPQGERECYRILFTDGSAFESDDSHLNVVIPRAGRPERIESTKSLYEKDFLWPNRARFPSISHPIEFPNSNVPLDPYLLGVLLGDGSLSNGSIGFTNPEPEIVERVRNSLPDGCELKQSTVEIEYRIRGLVPFIRDLGLYGHRSWEKFIPDCYKFSSVSDRVAVLRGLMDTDGTAKKNKYIEYNTSSLQLADDVKFLVESLGGKVSITSKIPTYLYHGERLTGREHFRLRIILKSFNPFSLKRKAAEYFIHENTEDKVIANIEPIGKRETVCFKVDSPTETFIANGQVVTHNTQTGAMRMKLKMHKHRAMDDSFIITAPTYKILNQSTLPAFLKIMDGYGRYNKQEAAFHMYNGGTCYMRTNTEADSIVGITNVRHIWGDEAGKYTLYFWENIQGRGSFKSCQIDLTTSPYTLNWIYKELIKPVSEGKRDDVTIVQAASIENPYFPAEEYYRREKTMDPRRFRMMYGGKWERMAGLVYDCWEDGRNRCAPFVLPQGTIFVGGIDWGYTDPFVVKIRAITPENEHYNVHEFYKTQLTPSQIIDQCKSLDNIYGITRFYCDPSRPEMILELNRAGLRAVGADNNILYGIEKHYELIKTGRFKTFEGSSPYSDDEIETYHWPEPQDLKPDQDAKLTMPVDQNNHCFTGDTMVMTINGEKRIKDIKTGDIVKTSNGYRPVLYFWDNGTKNILRIKFKNGAYLECTPDHRIFVENLGYVHAQKLTKGAKVRAIRSRKLLNLMGCYISGIQILSTKILDGISSVRPYTLALDAGIFTGTYTENFSEKYKKIAISTTKMETNSTTRRITWNLFQKKTIAQNTWTKKKGLGKDYSLQKYNRSQKNGMEAMRGGRGILSMLGKRFMSGWTTLARNAEKISKAKHLRSIASNIVTKIVNKELEIDALEWLEQKARVYDLTVSHEHNYYANGVLVHNCMDADRYITIHTYKGIRDLVASVPSEAPKQGEDQFKRIERLKRRKPSWAREGFN